MNNSFWDKQKKSFLALAPMAGITDSAFRQVCSEYGADIFYSEMASVDALFHAPRKTLEMLYFTEIERPYIVQLFGSNPKFFVDAINILEKEINPDAYDVNFGCPVKKVLKQGAGAALMADPEKSREVLKACLSATDKPISIKTRTASADVSLPRFLEKIEDLPIQALMIHGRTLKQGFSGPIDTKTIKESKNNFGGLIIANGGINSLSDAQKIYNETKADGLGLARGAMGRPWLFSEIKKSKDLSLDKKEIFAIALKHFNLVYDIKGESSIPEFRKHLAWYTRGLKGASELRKKAVGVKSKEDVLDLLYY